MTLANGQLRIATQLQHQLAETHARETFTGKNVAKTTVVYFIVTL